MPPLSRSLGGMNAAMHKTQIPTSRTDPMFRFLRSISVAKYQKNRISNPRPSRNRASGSSKTEVSASMGGKIGWEYPAAGSVGGTMD